MILNSFVFFLFLFLFLLQHNQTVISNSYACEPSLDVYAFVIALLWITNYILSAFFQSKVTFECIVTLPLFFPVHVVDFYFSSLCETLI